MTVPGTLGTRVDGLLRFDRSERVYGYRRTRVSMSS